MSSYVEVGLHIIANTINTVIMYSGLSVFERNNDKSLKQVQCFKWIY